MKRRIAAGLACVGLAAAWFASGVAASRAASPSVPLELWGLEAGDEVTVDGEPVTVRSGGASRAFVGDPEATNAPALKELSPGQHVVVVRRGACAPRTFAVVLEGVTRRAIVFEPEDPERCALPSPPPRR